MCLTCLNKHFDCLFYITTLTQKSMILPMLWALRSTHNEMACNFPDLCTTYTNWEDWKVG